MLRSWAMHPGLSTNTNIRKRSKKRLERQEKRLFFINELILGSLYLLQLKEVFVIGLFRYYETSRNIKNTVKIYISEIIFIWDLKILKRLIPVISRSFCTRPSTRPGLRKLRWTRLETSVGFFKTTSGNCWTKRRGKHSLIFCTTKNHNRC